MKLAGKKFPFWAIQITRKGPTSEKFSAWHINEPAGIANSLIADQVIHAHIFYGLGGHTGLASISRSRFKTFHKSSVYKMREPEMRYKAAIVMGLFNKLYS